MKQVMIGSEVDRIVDAKIQAKHSHTIVEALTDMLKTGYLVAVDEIMDAWYRFKENILTEMTLKETLDDLFIRNIER